MLLFYWKVDPFTKDDNINPFTEESSFTTLFLKYREQYLYLWSIWPLATKALEKHVYNFFPSRR